MIVIKIIIVIIIIIKINTNNKIRTIMIKIIINIILSIKTKTMIIVLLDWLHQRQPQQGPVQALRVLWNQKERKNFKHDYQGEICSGYRGEKRNRNHDACTWTLPAQTCNTAVPFLRPWHLIKQFTHPAQRKGDFQSDEHNQQHTHSIGRGT